MRQQQNAKIIQLENAMPREKWIKRITTAWREQLASIFETGNLLEAAKAELKHGEWTAMFQNGELPFKKDTAEKLIAIAQNDNVRNAEHVRHLPIHWGTLHALTKLTAEQFDNGITSGAINPQMQRKDVNALRGVQPKEDKKKEEPTSKPQTLDDWCDEFSVRATQAFTELSKTERSELLEHLKQTIAALEEENV